MKTTSSRAASQLNRLYEEANPHINSPEGYAALARHAAAQGEHYVAADWYHCARGVTLGANRAARYHEAEVEQTKLALAALEPPKLPELSRRLERLFNPR